MNTNYLKSFATEARIMLIKGVEHRLGFLGFDTTDGSVVGSEPQKVQGGTLFRGSDSYQESFYDKWMLIKQNIKTFGIRAVCEEAAYTWFNRFMAIRIMQENGLIEPVLLYDDSSRKIPHILSEAKNRRIMVDFDESQKKLFSELMTSNSDNKAFAMLILAYCRQDPVIKKCFGTNTYTGDVDTMEYIDLLLPDNILDGGFVDAINNTDYISEQDYKSPELIGWLYQFYISERKDEVFAAKSKVEAEDIPAATQIFTPNWIVKYMVQNTVGKIYLDNNPYATDVADDWKYLVENKEDKKSAHAEIDELTELTIADLACGSGHILVEAFDLLYNLYLEDGYSRDAAVENIFKHNITGVDIDTRARQLASFSLLMKASQKLERQYSEVMPQVYDMPKFVDRNTWDDVYEQFNETYHLAMPDEAQAELEDSFSLLKEADNLGSIMKFYISQSTDKYMSECIDAYENNPIESESYEKFVDALQIIKVLTKKYAAVVMNPPYMGSKNMNKVLSDYVKKNYEDSKSDLFAVFMEVVLDRIVKDGKYGMINMQSWMFLSSFEKLRNKVLSQSVIDSMIHLGARAFDELSGEVVQTTAFVISKSSPKDTCGIYHRLIDGNDCSDKQRMFLEGNHVYPNVKQDEFARIPGCPIAYWVSEKVLDIFSSETIKDYGFAGIGMRTGDNKRFLRFWYEVSINNFHIGCQNVQEQIEGAKKWVPYNKGGNFRKWYGNNSYVVNWYNNGEEIKENTRIQYPELGDDLGWKISNEKYYFKRGTTWTGVTTKDINCRYYGKGFIFDSGANGLFSYDEMNQLYLTGYLNTIVASNFNKLINPTINIGSGTIRQIPLIVQDYYRENINHLVTSNISISKQDWDAHETSWDFEQNELIRLKNRGLGFIQATLNDEIALEYYSLKLLLIEYKSCWKEKFKQLHANEEELNRQFIEIYDLEDELTPDVPFDEVTILQDGEITVKDNEIEWNDDVIIKQFISYAIGCMMGRYRLDKPGLAIAHPNPTDEEIAPYKVGEKVFEIDEDAIIPLMSSDSGFSDNAVDRLSDFVKFVFGQESLSDNWNLLQECLGKSVEKYLVKDFWKDHTKMYQKKPIYWLFSSKKGAFQVITYMHRMNAYTVEKIRSNYLLPHIEFLKSEIANLKQRASSLLQSEVKDMKRLEKELDECLAYHDDLKDVAEHQIEFDLDDGVTENYKLFGKVLKKI